MEQVTFYTKLDCCLCDQAYRLLLNVACGMPLEIDVVDITHAHNGDIKSLYAERIPVVAKAGANTELDWPFTTDDIKAYLVS